VQSQKGNCTHPRTTMHGCGGIVRMIARLQFCISRVIIGLGLFIGLRNEEALD
jgi:hypothetical protein